MISAAQPSKAADRPSVEDTREARQVPRSKAPYMCKIGASRRDDWSLRRPVRSHSYALMSGRQFDWAMSVIAWQLRSVSGKSVRVNASPPSEPPLEDRGPTSFAETAKNLFRKHKGKFLTGAVGLAIAGVVASLADGQDGEDTEPVPGPTVEDQPRQPPVRHEVTEHLVKLAAGRRASEAAKAAYRNATGEDLPPDYTWRSRSSRGGSSEARAPVQAPA